jgi:hypothetical protein
MDEIVKKLCECELGGKQAVRLARVIFRRYRELEQYTELAAAAGKTAFDARYEEVRGILESADLLDEYQGWRERQAEVKR